MEVVARNVGSFKAMSQPCDFYITDPPGRLTFICPCGCGDHYGISLKPENPNGWDWNGDEEKPTTRPSILCSKGDGEHWHGYLTDGVFRSC